MTFKSKTGVATATTLGVIGWYLVVFGVFSLLGILFGRQSLQPLMPFGVFFLLPLVPGAAACIVVGPHSAACGPTSLIGNILFYLGVVFIVRSRRAHRAGRNYWVEAQGNGRLKNAGHHFLRGDD